MGGGGEWAGRGLDPNPAPGVGEAHKRFFSSGERSLDAFPTSSLALVPLAPHPPV